MLRHFGHDDCAVIDLAAWRGPLLHGDEDVEPEQFVPRERGDDTIEADELAGRLDELVVVDARLPELVGVLWVERIGIDDPIGAVAVHGMSGVWGTLATGVFAVPALASNLATGQGGLVYTGFFHQLGVQALGLMTVGASTFSASFGSLWAMKRLWGIRVEPETETAGLDVSEHGMWGYPEFYIPVPVGYGTESHGHLGLAHAPQRAVPAPVVTTAPEPAG